MNDRTHLKSKTSLTRRSLIGGLMAFGLRPSHAFAQGFAGLGRDAGGFASVVPGKTLSFPADHGAHPDYRIEWWYLTANLKDTTGEAFGLQWTLFRQAMAPGGEDDGWASQQIWMGHAAVTSAKSHRSSETFARGGIGQAGVSASPLHAWIDSWELRGDDAMSANAVAPMSLAASGADFNYTLRLDADRPLVLQGNQGFSRKSDRGQASYYYSQPYFRASGTITLEAKPIQVSGQAWMDREWSSQPLASDQTGWDWFSLHLESGERLMLFRLRQTNGENYFSGNWIGRDGRSEQIVSSAITMTPTAFTQIETRKLPTSWRVGIASRGVAIETAPLNPNSWMETSFPYWEGPIMVSGSHSGVGYLEMTGY